MPSADMPSPFAVYASNFLTRSFMPAASTVSSQPLFYSVAEGSQGASDEHLRASELDDEGDPHLRQNPGDEDDPYLDEDELDMNSGSIPLIESTMKTSRATPGWLAHRPASPSSLSSSASSGSPPSELYGHRPPTPPPTRTTLTQSLLPRDGQVRPLFSLPDPARIPLRKYHDSIWTALWCTGLTSCALGSILVLFLTRKPSHIPSPLPYSTLTHIIPLFTLFTLLSVGISYGYLLVIRRAVRPALIATAVAIPTAMVFSALWAFSGSFFWSDKEPGWAETVGLRIFALVPLVFAILSARSLYASRDRLNQTIAVVELGTSFLLEQLPLLALSPILLFFSLIASLPFLSLFLHLLLIGYFSKDDSGWEWHVRPYAGWLAVATCAIWIWSWCISRGVLRVTVAAVVGSWYFNPTLTDAVTVTKYALSRAAGPSLGTICLSSLLLTAVNGFALLMHFLRRISSPPLIPAILHPLTIPTSIVTGIFSSLSSYALVFVGITGDSFFPSARRSQALTSLRGRRARKDYTLLSTLLTLSSFSAGFLAAIAGYLFTAYTLSRPSDAPLASFIAGILSFLVCWFCLSLVDDIADSLYLCYCMDVDVGLKHRNEVFQAFEGRHDPGPGLV